MSATGGGRSLLATLQKHIDMMLQRVNGMKVLLLDQETTAIISLVYSQSQLLERDVFLVERLEASATPPIASPESNHPEVQAPERLKHLNAVCFLRPSDRNFVLLTQVLKMPVFREYHLFFTNCIPSLRLEQLASADELEVVSQVKEVFTDVYAVSDDVFSLNQLSTIRICEGASALGYNRWSGYEEEVYKRHLEGVFALLVSLQGVTEGYRPYVRYGRASGISQKLAGDLAGKILEEGSLFEGTVLSD